LGPDSSVVICISENEALLFLTSLVCLFLVRVQAVTKIPVPVGTSFIFHPAGCCFPLQHQVSGSLVSRLSRRKQLWPELISQGTRAAHHSGWCVVALRQHEVLSFMYSTSF